MAVHCFGVEAPLIRMGDNLVNIITDSVLNSIELNANDIVGITESVVARSAGLYVTVDEIAEDIRNKFGENATINLYGMIYSRNRFSMILKGIARGAKKLNLVMSGFDEVGNPAGVNPFTGVDIKEYYQQIVESENCECSFGWFGEDCGYIYCGLHDYSEVVERMKERPNFYSLADICSDKNPDFGLLGCNKATEESLKLFPTRKLASDLCREVRTRIKNATGKDVIVMVYGDGCFHSPSIDGIPGTSIWEFADPVSWLSDEVGSFVLNRTPNEVKLKAAIDSTGSNEEVKNMIQANKRSNLFGSMTAMGTTPRHFGDLLASLMDLCSGSGDKGTPFVVVQHYFEKYSAATA